jgi:hypothetical protein
MFSPDIAGHYLELARAGQWNSEPGTACKKSRGLLAQPGAFEGFGPNKHALIRRSFPRRCQEIRRE